MSEVLRKEVVVGAGARWSFDGDVVVQPVAVDDHFGSGVDHALDAGGDGGSGDSDDYNGDYDGQRRCRLSKAKQRVPAD